MNNISSIGEKCCGCRSCESKCPSGAITFIESGEGFFYPAVDPEKCTDCGLCTKVCPALQINANTGMGKAYAAWINDDVVLSESSSGGVFSALAEKVINSGGYVCGCTYDKALLPKHILIDKVSDLKLLRGSKYVESDIAGIFSDIERLLKLGNKVLFSGVPCQVAGLKKYLGKDCENLFTVDIICHGVPSRKLFKKYLEWEEEKRKARIVSFDFRSKKKHSWSLTYRMKYERGNKTFVEEKMASFSPYYTGFLNSQGYRRSCYDCRYANDNRVGDITLGDFWGVDKEYPGLFNDEGVSCVLINTSKGEKALKEISNDLFLKEVDRKAVVNNNGQLQHPSKTPKGRDEIYKLLDSDGFEAVSRSYMMADYSTADILKNMIPQRIRNKIKHIIRG